MAAAWSSLGGFCLLGAVLCQSPTPAAMLQTFQTYSALALSTPPSPLCFLLSSENGALPHLHQGIAVEHQIICTALHSSAPPGGLRAHHQLLLFCCKGKLWPKHKASLHTLLIQGLHKFFTFHSVLLGYLSAAAPGHTAQDHHDIRHGQRMTLAQE